MDINSRVEAAKEKVASLQRKIEDTQASKRDQTIGQVLRSKGETPASVRAPPSTKLRRTLKGHFGKVVALHWSGDSSHLVSASQDGNLLVWNTVTGNKTQSVSLKSSYVMAVGMEQGRGQMLACGGLDNLCTVYRLGAPEKAIEMASHDGFISCCRFLSEDKILTSSGDSTCIRWDIATGTPLNTFAEHTADVMFLSIKPEDNNVFVSCSVDKTVKVWDVRAPRSSMQTFKCHNDDINAIEFMPTDGNAFATCSQDNSVCLFDIRACNVLNRFGNQNSGSTESSMPEEGYTSLAFSRSGRLIFCGHSDGSVLAYDVLSEKKTSTFTINGAHDRVVSCVGVSPKGDALCTGSWDGLLKIWA
ncbi:guanine nucleotide-binding protein G(I)/G(S)/G(T) subunit beta-1 [Fistulifera solaris]|uniref:Guanine nucleotide-binding protein G(I)/G(S)/G(T) subunit beta-1 n=1 Tax=Fistulifera solaris TaxID=1519565 RepID=A0A1Z5K756_FISSO|nr:guanine nucleotide-binding protein G(I)/G(S)/G(T) subunit beta-1 [Fistulifera solaris]|eukprot:GAX21992.1 guanine nucleotide-binding protein G(I)/G(S)/G(T) subunit beta-1 [Fistulifera solaris]